MAEKIKITPHQDNDNRPSLWSTKGFWLSFFLGVLIFSGEAALITLILPMNKLQNLVFFPLIIGFLLVIFLGIRARKFGYVTGFIVGLCVGVAVAAMLFLAACAFLMSGGLRI